MVARDPHPGEGRRCCPAKRRFWWQPVPVERSPMSREVDTILAECSAPHGNDRRFLEAVRPMAELILHPATPRRHLPQLREMLSQTCARDSSMRRKCQEAQETLHLFFDELEDLLLCLRRSLT